MGCKRSVLIPIPRKGNAKECSNYCTISLISHASKVMLYILQTRLQLFVNQEFPEVQVGFGKGRGTKDQIANIQWIIEKAKEFQKNNYFCFIDYAKTFDCVDHNKLWKILKEIGIPDHLTFVTFVQFFVTPWTAARQASWEIWIQVEKQQSELDMEKQTRSISGKEYVKAVNCHPAYLTSMQSTSGETLGWKKHKLESRLLGEISITSDRQMTPPLWQKVKRN